MKAKAALLSLFALSAYVVQAQQVVDMQPGLWESRMLRMEKDGEDWLEQQREDSRAAQERQMQLPPEQRRQIRDPLVSRGCFSESDLNDLLSFRIMLGERDVCPLPNVSRDDTRITLEATCKGRTGSAPYKVKMEIVMPNETSVEMVTTLVFPEPNGYTMVMESNMKFLGSDCGDAPYPMSR